MKEHWWIISALIEGERVYFAGMRPTESGPSDCVWSPDMDAACRFPLRQAAVDTARAMRVGDVWLDR